LLERLEQLARALPEWTPRYESLDKSYQVQSPSYKVDGISVSGPSVEAVIERARVLLEVWAPQVVDHD